LSIGIVKLKDDQKIPEPSEADRKGLVVNCYDVPLDVNIKGGGCVVVLNRNNLPTVELVGLGADLVRLHGGAMCSPGFSCDSAYQVRIYQHLISLFYQLICYLAHAHFHYLRKKHLGGTVLVNWHVLKFSSSSN
jgi:hypothetical protein